MDGELMVGIGLLVTGVVSTIVAVLAKRESRAAGRDARRSADAAEKACRLMSEQDLRERSPRFELMWEGEIGRQGGAVAYAATLRLLGPEGLGMVRLRLLDPPSTEPAAAVYLVGPGNLHSKEVSLGAVDVGKAVTFGVVPTHDSDARVTGGILHLQAIARAAEERSAGCDDWVVALRVAIPSTASYR